MSEHHDKKLIAGITESAMTEPWRDRRVMHKAKEAAKLERLRRSVLQTAAHKSRATALAMGHPRYLGHRCKRGHEGERYSNDGNCCECVRLAAEHRRRLRGCGVLGPRPAARHPIKSRRRAAARARRSRTASS